MENEDFIEKLKKDGHMLEQPLLTEDGFVNPACINELNAAIKNMPKLYERLANEPEWTEKQITTPDEILAAFVKASIRTFPAKKNICNVPFGLERVANFLGVCLIKEIKWKSIGEGFQFAYLSLCEINKLLFDILYEQEVSLFDNWNKSEGPLGERWLDLDALLHNTCLDIRQDRRARSEFDKKFEEEQKKNENRTKSKI